MEYHRFLGDLNASVPVHHLRRLGRQAESIFAEIHSRVEQEVGRARKIGAGEKRWERRGREEARGEDRTSDSRIALQARLTGYRKAVGNSIPTCTARPPGKIIPSTLPPAVER